MFLIRLATLVAVAFFSTRLPAEPPPLMLANSYRPGIALQDYWVSEKLDGVRAYWNGHELISRGGHPINAPEWFTRHFPTEPLDGELWAGRQRFELVSGAARRAQPETHQWRQIQYWVFDLPASPLIFTQRLERLQVLIQEAALPQLRLVEQQRLDSEEQLMTRLEQVVAAGGEGLMLHRGNSHYRGMRSDDLIKLKTFDDAEAQVIAHLPGRGKYRGQLGALLVENADGRRFRLGSGFSDQERQNPPPIGSQVTYKYYGTTRTGLPRFASYLRIRSIP